MTKLRNSIGILLLTLYLSGCAGVMLTLSGIAGGLSIADSAYSLYDRYLRATEEEEEK